MIRVRCNECDWRGMDGELLRADNPFFPMDEIIGCPKCYAINEDYAVCDEPGCWKQSTMGTPTPEGYRHTCWNHKPSEVTK